MISRPLWTEKIPTFAAQKAAKMGHPALNLQLLAV
jgi:hypothetical protein